MSIFVPLALDLDPSVAAAVLPPMFHGALVIFGDSLTDDGITTTPQNLHGFKRANNGHIWTEYLADMLGLVDSYGSRKRALNMSYAGALTGTENYYFNKGWSGLLWQIDQFLKESKDSLNPDTTICFIQSCVNDIIDGVDNTKMAVDNLLTAVQTLAQTGLKNIVIFTLADLYLAPALKEDCPALKEPLGKLVKAANELLVPRVEEFRAANPQLHLVLVDFNSIWPEVEQKFAYPDDACYYRIIRPSPGDIKEYAWYDDWHPATGVQEILARKVVEALRMEFGDLLITPWETMRKLCQEKLTAAIKEKFPEASAS